MGLILFSAIVLFCAMFGAGFLWTRALLPNADGADHVALSMACSTVVFALISATGLVVPWSFALHSAAGGAIYVAGAAVLAVRKRGAVAGLRAEWVLWMPFALMFCFVTAFGLVQGDPPATVSWPGLFYSARVPALPADHALPHRTAEFIQTRTGPNDDDYFLAWTFWDRTPLAGLVAASSAAAVGVEYPMVAPWGLLPEVEQEARRVDKVGFWHAHVVGTLLNGAVVLAVGRLALSRFDRRVALLAGLFAAVTPYVLVHTFYTWPKMLAAYFVLLHFTYWRERRLPALVGGCASLAYLAHPLGVLYVIGTMAVSLLRRGRAAVVTLGSAVLVLLPWQLWTMLDGAPSRMLTYPLGVTMESPETDLMGELSTAWTAFREAGLSRALDIRMGTAVDAFVPLDEGPMWWLGPEIQAQWGWKADWFMVHNTPLTGIVLFALVPAAVLGLRRWFRDSSTEVTAFFVVPFVTTLVYWGLDARGLGVDSYQPMGALLFVAVAAGLFALPAGWRRALLAIGIVESASVIWFALYAEASYAPDWLVVGAVGPWVVIAASLFRAGWRPNQPPEPTENADEPTPAVELAERKAASLAG